jgi:mono/diheme cytochrome c family protein
MSKKPLFMGLVFATSSVAMLLAADAAGWWSCAKAGPPSARRDANPGQWAIVRVELPVSDEIFPRGIGADTATSQCLICHSAGMVLRQPPLTKDEWRAEIMKMRSAYGALVADDQVDGLSEYLKSINGQK